MNLSASDAIEGITKELVKIGLQLVGEAKKDKISEAAIQSLSVAAQTFQVYLVQAQNIKLQAATVDELARQSRWTKWLALSTMALAGATAVLALLTYVKR
jgi:hypothetical protein